MKQHGSHRPHQWSSAGGQVDREGPVTAAEDLVVALEEGETLGHPELGVGAEQREVGETGPEVLRARARSEVLFEGVALGVLVVDGPSVGRDRPERGRPLVGHDDGVVAEEDRRQDGDGREDAGHRDVTVQEAELGRGQHLGIDPPFGPHDREAR